MDIVFLDCPVRINKKLFALLVLSSVVGSARWSTIGIIYCDTKIYRKNQHCWYDGFPWTLILHLLSHTSGLLVGIFVDTSKSKKKIESSSFKIQCSGEPQSVVECFTITQKKIPTKNIATNHVRQHYYFLLVHIEHKNPGAFGKQLSRPHFCWITRNLGVPGTKKRNRRCFCPGAYFKGIYI